MEPDWANLEACPLSLILDKLEEKIDHLWFSAVCKNWQLIAKLNHQNHEFKINTIPMLIVPTESLQQAAASFTEKNGLFGISNKRLYPFQFQLGLIKPKLRICGSSHGWLALADDSKSIIILMNPFKDIPHIILPPINRVYKITLSADPTESPNDYVVAAIYGNNGGDLAFIRRGQKSWTYIDILEPSFIDVIFYKGLLFALSIHREIVSINICVSNDLLHNKRINPNVILPEKVDEGFLQDKFLVKSLNEELWMVRRCTLSKKIYHVYKLKLDAKSEKLEDIYKLKSLGDNILFLGKGDSIAVSASYFSKSLERDSIYFDDYLKIYNMKTGKSRCHSPYGSYTFWILPHFQWD
ncbi:putative F-box protein At5g55150 [Vicia villosa]|uniref:putative F-box protein At5g55150 n=1 Tax=Vicia villosa TaxID=3911 RepID=UPI00273BA6C5|nr:putative F-box protein At5g55150 [Vicia villosa]